MYKEILETNRLFLKPISKTHISAQYVSWLNDYETYKYLETRGNYTLEMLDSFVNEQIRNNVSMWGIHLKKDYKHIGNIKIDPINLKHKFGEYGILIGDKSELGKGYAQEASQAVIDYFFYDEYYLRKINLGVVNENSGAINLYKKLGFVIEGVYKNHLMYDNKYFDVIRMALFNPNYIYG